MTHESLRIPKSVVDLVALLIDGRIRGVDHWNHVCAAEPARGRALRWFERILCDPESMADHFLLLDSLCPDYEQKAASEWCVVDPQYEAMVNLILSDGPRLLQIPEHTPEVGMLLLDPPTLRWIADRVDRWCSADDDEVSEAHAAAGPGQLPDAWLDALVRVQKEIEAESADTSPSVSMRDVDAPLSTGQDGGTHEQRDESGEKDPVEATRGLSSEPLVLRGERSPSDADQPDTASESIRHTTEALHEDFSKLRALEQDAQSDYLQGRYTDARIALSAILEVLHHRLGHDHPASIRSMSNLGVLLYAVGKLDEAQAVQKEVLRRYLRTLGPDHPDTLASRRTLSLTVYAAGELSQARSLVEETLDRSLRTLGREHLNTLFSAQLLAVIRAGEGDLEGARELVERIRAALGLHGQAAVGISGSKEPTLVGFVHQWDKLKDASVSSQAAPIEEVSSKLRRVILANYPGLASTTRLAQSGSEDV